MGVESLRKKQHFLKSFFNGPAQKPKIPKWASPNREFPKWASPYQEFLKWASPYQERVHNTLLDTWSIQNSFDKWLHVNLLFQSCCLNRSMSPVIEKMTWSEFQDLPRSIYSNLSLIHNFSWNMFMHVLHSEIFTPLKKTTLSEIWIWWNLVRAFPKN